MKLRVRFENEIPTFSLVEDDRNYSIPTAFFEAAYPNYTAEEDEEKED